MQSALKRKPHCRPVLFVKSLSVPQSIKPEELWRCLQNSHFKLGAFFSTDAKSARSAQSRSKSKTGTTAGLSAAQLGKTLPSKFISQSLKESATHF